MEALGKVKMTKKAKTKTIAHVTKVSTANQILNIEKMQKTLMIVGKQCIKS